MEKAFTYFFRSVLREKSQLLQQSALKSADELVGVFPSHHRLLTHRDSQIIVKTN